MNHKITVHTIDELSGVKALQKELATLKVLQINKDLDSLVLDSYLELAAELLGYKNVEIKLSSLHKPRL